MVGNTHYAVSDAKKLFGNQMSVQYSLYVSGTHTQICLNVSGMSYDNFTIGNSLRTASTFSGATADLGRSSGNSFGSEVRRQLNSEY